MELDWVFGIIGSVAYASGLGLIGVLGLLLFMTVFLARFNWKQTKIIWATMQAALTPFMNGLHYIYMALAAVGVIAVLSSGWPGGKLGIPPPESLERDFAERLFGFYFPVFVGHYLRCLGFPPGLQAGERLRLIKASRWSFGFLGIAGMLFPGSYGIAVFIPVIAGVLMSYYWTAHLARVAFDKSQTARDFGELSRPVHTKMRCLFAHASDIHITASNEETLEGHSPGNARFMAALRLLRHINPELLLITGDIVDRGQPEEWKVVTELLYDFQKDQLEKKKECHILLALGNHDVATAYSPTDVYMAIELQRVLKEDLPRVNGQRYWEYLRQAARLEPDLCDCAGRKLAEQVAAVDNKEREIAETWESLHKQVASGTRDVESAIAEMSDRIQDLSSTANIHELRSYFLSNRTANLFREVEMPAFYRQKWYEPFPLRYFHAPSDTEVVILNSIAQDPTVLGSAWGQYGQEQLSRLDSLLKNIEGYRVIILTHHAPHKWQLKDNSYVDAPRWNISDLICWGMLVLLNEEATRLGEILESVKHRLRVTLLCGHRHGGKYRISRAGAWRGGGIVEAASLADDGTPVLVGVIGESRDEYYALPLE